MSRKVTVEGLGNAIADMMNEYSDAVYLATEEGLDDAEKVLLNNLRQYSPKDSGKYAAGWQGRGKKYKLRRYVGNVTEVPSKKGRKPIPLSNVLEYADRSPYRGHIKRIYAMSMKGMIEAAVDEIRKGV